LPRETLASTLERNAEIHLFEDTFMRVNNVAIILLIVLCDVFDVRMLANAQQLFSGRIPLPDSSVMNSKQTADSPPWGNTLYLSAGWGVPQGARFEVGYNVGAIISLGLSLGIGDSWSRHPGEGTLAILGAIRIPTNALRITPYLLFCRGGTFSNFLGDSDTFTLLYFGAMVPLNPRVQFRPEIGFDFTSKHISGGRSLFGGSSPEVSENKLRLGVNVSLEFDLARLF
jgi:hypothetical protein